MANYYYVTPKCTTPSREALFLTAESVGDGVTVTLLQPNNFYQHWEIQDIANLPITLVNRQTKQVISAGNNNGPVVQINPNSTFVCTPNGTTTSARTVWNVCPPTVHHYFDQAPSSTAPYGALQLAADTNMNLNVQGNAPYYSGTPVMAWSWGGGADNEVWQLTQIV